MAAAFEECRIFATGGPRDTSAATTTVSLFVGHFCQRRKTRMSLHRSHNVTVLCAAEKIALPTTGNGSVFDFCGCLHDGNGIDDLTTGLSAGTRVPRVAYAVRTRMLTQEDRLPRLGYLGFAGFVCCSDDFGELYAPLLLMNSSL